MKYHVIIVTLCVGIRLTFSPVQGIAQEVQELSGEETSEDIERMVQPPSSPPAEFTTGGTDGRGISLAMKVRCNQSETENGRSVKLVERKPVAKPVALRIEFDKASAELSEATREGLDKMAAALNTGDTRFCCFRIEGHTDSVGSEASNRRLSVKRAQSVVRYLTQEHGIDRQRILSEGYGESTPVADNSTQGGRQKNRRVQFANLGYGSKANDTASSGK